MSFLKRLFGGGSSSEPTAPPEVYNDVTIVATPIKEGGQYRLCAELSKNIDGEIKVHKLIRADMLESYDAACDVARAKARQVIDEQGNRLFL